MLFQQDIRICSKSTSVQSKWATTHKLIDFKPPDERLLVITNPPYGERLLDVAEAEKLYKIMGEQFDRTQGKKYFIISPHDEFEKHFGKKSDNARKMYNGMLRCYYYQYYK